MFKDVFRWSGWDTSSKIWVATLDVFYRLWRVCFYISFFFFWQSPRGFFKIRWDYLRVWLTCCTSWLRATETISNKTQVSVEKQDEKVAEREKSHRRLIPTLLHRKIPKSRNPDSRTNEQKRNNSRMQSIYSHSHRNFNLRALLRTFGAATFCYFIYRTMT